jgi:hypothetical protein
MVKTKPSKSKPCPLRNAITIHLKNSDAVEYYNVDDRGYIRPNKRGWIGLDVTVITGKHEVKDQSVYVPVGCKIWVCQVLNNSYVSSISSDFAEQEVTLIIHK